MPILQGLVVRAPVRGGSLLNRKAQFAKISREPIVRENTGLFNVSTVSPTKVGQGRQSEVNFGVEWLFPFCYSILDCYSAVVTPSCLQGSDVHCCI